MTYINQQKYKITMWDEKRLTWERSYRLRVQSKNLSSQNYCVLLLLNQNLLRRLMSCIIILVSCLNLSSLALNTIWSFLISKTWLIFSNICFSIFRCSQLFPVLGVGLTYIINHIHIIIYHIILHFTYIVGIYRTVGQTRPHAASSVPSIVPSSQYSSLYI